MQPFTMTNDAHDTIFQIIHTGQTWLDELPTGIDPELSTRRGRINGAAFSLVVLIDGDSGLGPLRLSPTTHPDIDLGGLALHETMNADPATLPDQHQRDLLTRLQELVNVAVSSPAPLPEAMWQFLLGFCHLLAHNYHLHLIETDEDGYAAAEGPNIAPELPEAFTSEWLRLSPDLLPADGAAPAKLAETPELQPGD